MENKDEDLKLSDTELDEVAGGLKIIKAAPFKPTYKCDFCQKIFKTQAELSAHKLICAKGKSSKSIMG